jgi:hypothetical protein
MLLTHARDSGCWLCCEAAADHQALEMIALLAGAVPSMS